MSMYSPKPKKKNHVIDLVHIDFDDDAARLVEILIEYLELDPTAYIWKDYGYDEDSTYYVVIERPMNEQELAKAEAKRAKDRENAKKSKERAKETDLATIKKLAQKHGIEIKEIT